MVSLILLVVGFILLVWGADRFVMGAAAITRKFGVSPLIIGLTIVSFGTSAPELAVSVTAALKGANEIAVGNVLGSNIFNLLVVAGVSAIICPLVASRELVRRDWVLSIVAALAMGGFLLTGHTLSRFEGVLLLVGFAAMLTAQLRPALRERNVVTDDSEEQCLSTGRLVFRIILGLAMVVIGGDLSVDGAVGLARMIGLSEAVIGLTVVAIGTSLPELVTSITAARRGENDIALGNVIGSNLFNILFILGLSATLNPIPVQPGSITDTLVLAAVSIVFLIPAWKGRIKRPAGVCMTACYIVYMAFLLM